MAWDKEKNASKIWIFLGFLGIGYLIALIYSLISNHDEDRLYGILFILGFLGSIIIYILEKDKDRYLSSLALYLLIGTIIDIVVGIILFSLGVFMPHIVV